MSTEDQADHAAEDGFAHRRIRTTPDKRQTQRLLIGGWFQGAATYLWLGDAETGVCLNTLSGQKLYRLAKAIVREFEDDRARKAGAVTKGARWK